MIRADGCRIEPAANGINLEGLRTGLPPEPLCLEVQLGGWPSLPQPRIVTKYARIHILDRQSRCRRRGPRSVRTVKSTDNEAEDEDETITSSRQGEQAAMIVGFRNKAIQWQHSMESENSDGSRATQRCEEEATRSVPSDVCGRTLHERSSTIGCSMVAISR